MLLVVLLAAAGCGTEPDAGGDSLGSPDLIGTITSVTPAASGPALGTIGFDVRKPDAGSQVDKYVITIDADTLVYRQVGEKPGNLGDVGFEALESGQRAEVWLAGPVAESFPMQATAGVIVISGTATPRS
ncbi:MAG: hypothetical protein C4534_10175 [Gaiellales bacterium]|nr:MAG: hypothetical protein C4534_10175 [Gaiellales bacterium]